MEITFKNTRNAKRCAAQRGATGPIRKKFFNIKARFRAPDCTAFARNQRKRPPDCSGGRSTFHFIRSATGIGAEIVQLSTTAGLPALVSTIRYFAEFW